MSSRGLALIATAIVLSAGLIGVQLASGGADFVPQRPADPCQDRGRPAPANLEGLAEAVVLTGIDEAACKLGVTRERLLLALPSKPDRAELARELGTDEQGLAQATKDGLLRGIDRLEKAGQLPKASALLPSVAEQLGISPGLAGLIPDNVVDNLVPTADLLRRSIEKTDVNAVLADLDDSKALEATLREALFKAAIEEAKARIAGQLPSSLQGLFG